MKPTLQKQPRNSQWCGPACLQMAFEALGEKRPMKNIASELPISETFGIGLFDLALYPVSAGAKVDAFAWDAQHMPAAWRTLKPAEILRLLNKETLKPGSWKAALKKLLESGGRLFVRPLLPKEIEKRLKKGEQMIMYIDSGVFDKKGEGVWGHYVVVTHIGKTTITFLDPHWKHGGIRKINRDLVLFNFASLGGYAMFIKK